MKTWIINGVEITAFTESRAILEYAMNVLQWAKNDIRIFANGDVWYTRTSERVKLEIIPK